LPLPELTIGLVVRYEHLWARRAETADKDHPACIVVTYRVEGRPEDFVIYLPISHSPPQDEEEGVELPDAVKARAGLDARPQWVLISECNIDTWPQDLRQVPHHPGRFHYGHLPPSFFRALRDRFVERYRAQRIARVSRFD
jgi:hypothetical protein